MQLVYVFEYVLLFYCKKINYPIRRQLDGLVELQFILSNTLFMYTINPYYATHPPLCLVPKAQRVVEKQLPKITCV